MPALQKYIKVNGLLVNFKATSCSGSFSSSQPSAFSFTMELPYNVSLPFVGQSVEVFLKDDTKIFGGTIDQIEWNGMVEGTDVLPGPDVGSTRLSIGIKCVGYDNRLFIRTTYNWGTGQSASFNSYAGYADVLGTIMTWHSGRKFGQDMVGRGVKFGGAGPFYVVASVQSPKKLTLASSPGTLTDTFYEVTIYSGTVIEQLLDTYAAGEGFTYADGITIQAGAAISRFQVNEDILLFDPPGSVMDAINKILQLNPTYYFAVTPTQVVYFAQRTLVPAPVNFTDVTSAYKRGIKVTTTREDVRNAEISQVDSKLLLNHVVSIQGDGSTVAWFLDLPIKSFISATLNGAPVTVSDSNSQFSGKVNVDPDGVTVHWVGGDFFNNSLIGQSVSINGVLYPVSTVTARDTALLVSPGSGGALSNVDLYYSPLTDFWFEVNTNKLWALESLAVLGIGDTLILTYVALDGDVITYQDSAAIISRAGVEGSGSGRYEQVVPRTQFPSVLAAKADQVNSVTRLEGDLKTVVLETYDVGYRAGQAVLINIANRNINQTMFIDSVEINDAQCYGTPYDFLYTLSTISTTRRITSADALRQLFGVSASFQGGAGGASAAVGTSLAPLQSVALASAGGLNLPFNVYKGIGDGATDNTAGLNNAIANATNGYLWIPPGIYIHQPLTITKPITIVLAANCTLKLKAGSTSHQITINSSFVSIYGPGTLDGSSASNPSGLCGIQANTGASNLNFEGLTFTNHKTSNIKVESALIHIRRNTFNGSGAEAVYFDDHDRTSYVVTAASWAAGVATVTIGAHSMAIGNLFSVNTSNPSGWDAVQVAVTAITGTTISYALAMDPGAWVGSSYVSVETGPDAQKGTVNGVRGSDISDNTFLAGLNNAIKLVTSKGNLIDRNWITGYTRMPIEVFGRSDNSTITNNRCYILSNTYPAFGISVDASDGSIVQGNYIRFLSPAPSIGYGIEIAFSNYVNCSGNEIVDAYTAIQCTTSSYCVIDHNTVTRFSAGYRNGAGIVIYGDHSTARPSFRNKVSNNTIKFTGKQYGIWIQNGGTGFAVTAGSWAAGIATVTIGAHTLVVGETIAVHTSTPAGYDTNATPITAVTGTTVSYALASDPGAWASGSILVSMGIASNNDIVNNSIEGDCTLQSVGIQIENDLGTYCSIADHNMLALNSCKNVDIGIVNGNFVTNTLIYEGAWDSVSTHVFNNGTLVSTGPFSRFTPTTADWYRLLISANAVMSGTMDILATYHNKYSYLTVDFRSAPYGGSSFVSIRNSGAYAGFMGVIDKIEASSDGANNAYLDIHIVDVTSPTAINITYSGQSILAAWVIPAPVAGAVPGASSISLLDFATTNANIPPSIFVSGLAIVDALQVGVTTVALLGSVVLAEGKFKVVSDALAPVFLATVVGGGAVHTPVYCNGTNWICLSGSLAGAPPIGAAGGDLAGTYPNPTLKNTGTAGAQSPIVTTDAQGRVTSSADPVNLNITGVYSVSGTQVVQARGAAISAQGAAVSGIAGVVYTSTEQTIINNLINLANNNRTRVADLVARLQAHGLIS